jgi:hypothetical protein
MSHNVFKVPSPSFPWMTTEQQIFYGLNDWAVEGKSGHLYYGRTEQEALDIAAMYNFV